MIFDSKWITYKTGDNDSPDDRYGDPSPYFRRGFTVDGEIKKATLFAAALGVFKIYINGSAASDEYFAPGWVDYHKKLPYVRYDITEMLAERNAVGVVLGDGWAVGHLGSTYAFKRCGYSPRIEFTALLRLEYADGRVEEITTDGSWRASTGAIRRSDIYMGEYVDARLDLGDFSSPDYDESAWDYAEETVFKFSRNLYLEERIAPPIVVKHVFKPRLVRRNGNVYLFDVTQNIAGVICLKLKGKRGDNAVIRHGELLSEGELYTENLRKAEATDTYILSGNGEETFSPIFTYHGFQFAEITLSEGVEIVEITALSTYSDLSAVGEFSCSDPLVNRIYLNALWGQRDNFMSVPTDCPQRDERLGWTADAQIFARSAMWNMNCKTYYEKYLADIRDAQLGNGVIPAVAPVPPVGSYAYTGRDAAAGWCEAIGELPYDHFVMYGDNRVIRDNLPNLKKLISYYEKESPDGIRSGKGAYGDWLSLGTPSDISAISTLYYARAARIAAWMCSVIGDTEEAYYTALYEKVKAAFKERFMDADGRIVSDTQSLYVIAYKSGIIDKDAVKTYLLRKFTEDKGKLTTGFLGIKFLLPTLSEIGRSDIAYGLITSREFPGWGYSVVNGATTIWEHWDSYTLDGGIRKGMNSFNHYSFGSCTEWMYEYCLGIRPSVEGGFKRVTFAPCFDESGKITSAKGHYDSPFGRIEVEWSKTEVGFEYIVTVPEGIESSFDFGGMEIADKSQTANEYRFLLR